MLADMSLKPCHAWGLCDREIVAVNIWGTSHQWWNMCQVHLVDFKIRYDRKQSIQGIVLLRVMPGVDAEADVSVEVMLTRWINFLYMCQESR